ncbi:hypothetical protein DITRI_Ditri09bG0141400 [Diplodiscus trichospermus]
MEALMKAICVLLFLVIMTISGFNGVDGHGTYYGPCGKHDIEKEAEKLAPCTEAAKYVQAPVSERCCTIMDKKLKNPSCLCAVMFSRTAYYAGIKPEVAVTIPKRCNIRVRPVGYKCGAFPFLVVVNKEMEAPEKDGTAKSSGIKPEVAVNIPKRCNICGLQCGVYRMP